jgi:hypothetical protein
LSLQVYFVTSLSATVEVTTATELSFIPDAWRDERTLPFLKCLLKSKHRQEQQGECSFHYTTGY